MSPVLDTTPLRLVLPKGRMQDGVLGLLRDAGIALTLGARTSRPVISLSDVSGGACAHAARLGRLEGLEGHARSAERRR